MGRKKAFRMPEPNMKLYFIALALFVVAALPFSPALAAAEGAAAAALCLLFVRESRQRRVRVVQYLDSVTGSVDVAGKSNLINSPLPTMVFRPDTGEILWSNEGFSRLAGRQAGLFESRLEDTVPGFSAQWLLAGKRECPEGVELNGRRFRVYGSMARPRGKDQNLVATTYWVETTETDALREVYEAGRPVIAVLVLDNYEDLMKACPESRRSALQAQLEEKLNDWAKDGLLLRMARDRFLYLFDEKTCVRLTAEKFSVLDTLRNIQAGGLNATLSIGVGKDADGFPALYQSACVALEMALSRGGDQAVVRNRVDFVFFGGRAKAAEKRTKVKSRVMASALGELMADADEVYAMGHAHADMDAVGAAAGVCCAARAKGKPCHIVISAEGSSARELIEELEALPEYKGVFLDPNEAFLRMVPGTLLVVVDTNRPEMVESPQILESCNRVAVIDHHRRAASYIENAAFSFHEPGASSASELVAELLQYLLEDSSVLLRGEADAMLAGMVLDTKHFSQRTSARTFEAASFLRSRGADTERVQKLFQSDLAGMIARYGIIRRGEVIRPGIALAAADEDGIDRVTAAQAADELLTLKGVQASFVVFRHGEDVLLSARSLGDVNVQVILEALGGGGNSTAAGGRVSGAAVEDVRRKLTAAIDAYLEQA